MSMLFSAGSVNKLGVFKNA